MAGSGFDELLLNLPGDRPLLIAGPTASGKSALALSVAARAGGVIINADALQVFANWRILTARPSKAEEEAARHVLYGHVPGDQPYSVGHWLRDLEPYLDGPERPIIVGGTGLNFTALTEGLAEIPETPPQVRAEGEALLASEGLEAMCAQLDDATLARIDRRNPARVARAWEVLVATGRGLASWQDDTPAPRLPLEKVTAIAIEAERDWLRARIERRFDSMLAAGALEEARANLVNWDAKSPSAKAIGASQLIAYLQGEMALEEARAQAIIASQQYAKRQRSWLRARMRNWGSLKLPWTENQQTPMG